MGPELELTWDVAAYGLAGLLIILGSIGRYLQQKRSAKPHADPLLTGVGLELGTRVQIDMLISAVNRIGDILENKRQAGLEEMLKDIRDDMEKLKRPPPRRLRSR